MSQSSRSAPEERVARRTHAALALQRLDQDAGGVRTDRLLHGFDIAERHLVEAVERRAEAFEIFGSAGRGERAERAAMERAFEGDDARSARDGPWRNDSGGSTLIAHSIASAPELAEEHEVGKALFAQPRGEAARRPGS